MPTGFGALNHRKPAETVGNTYGERREKGVENPREKGGWQAIQGAIKDFFLGSIKSKHIQDFSNNADRYEAARTSKINRVQQGTAHSSGISRPSNDQYTGYLSGLIKHLDTKVPKKKQI
ncbi:MAG: hypothetical protein A2W61_05145 [Deltaproteobacteria bacterium RIFCSPLOWO2_01_44_7]|nr:MAG: hypothetical protein A2712_09275 [Deltaproteobacteria bacterium RIFCSPHIGHO2_01_FULL_43_49]OGQ38968.1 MAG: hypothetical protein A2W61_05145 [Deltaproteobacteria bacterium RIFCSPLOWO2_01_44_7]